MPFRQLRDLLGITDVRRDLRRIHNQLNNQETIMATAAEQLTELKTAFTDFAADVDAKLDQLTQAQGTLNPEAQVVFDELKAAVQSADERVGDADGSDTPTEPTEPGTDSFR